MSQLLLINYGDHIRYSPMVQCPKSLVKRNRKVLLHSVLPICPSLRGQKIEDSTLHRRHSTLCSVDHGDLLHNLSLNLSLVVSVRCRIWKLLTRILTVSEVRELHIDMLLIPDIIDHPRSYINIHGFNEFGIAPLGVILRIDASVESTPAKHKN